MKRAWIAGIAGPIGFLAVSFAMAFARGDLVREQGWVSWPSSMALGGPPVALVQIGAFLWLAVCYSVFAIGSLRPAFGWSLPACGYLAVALGDVLLGFPTDGPGETATWHGGVHLVGVAWVTVATLLAVAGVSVATRTDPRWRGWRRVAWIPFLAALVGVGGGFEVGWAKVTFVVGITLPGAVVGLLMRSQPARRELT